jgi:hypothetical protein
MIAKVLVVAALVCAVLALFVTKAVLGLDAVQFAALGVGCLAVAALL